MAEYFTNFNYLDKETTTTTHLSQDLCWLFNEQVYIRRDPFQKKHF